MSNTASDEVKHCRGWSSLPLCCAFFMPEIQNAIGSESSLRSPLFCPVVIEKRFSSARSGH